MDYREKDIADDRKDQSQNENNAQPGGGRVDNGAGLDEKDLEKNLLFGKGNNAPNPTEGKGAGGQNFGKENNTPAGNDKNNPTQMAGHTNAYFDRNEPSDEHPENSNFTAKYQEGAPDYDKAQPNIPGPNELPDQQKVGEDDSEDHIET